MSQNQVLPYLATKPTIGKNVYIAPGAYIIGDCVLENDVSVWFNAVIRADVNEIRIGKKTNIQDGSVIHVTTNGLGTYIGEGVTIGHRVVLHACKIDNFSLIGMGSVILDGAHIGSECMVAANSLITPNQKFPSGSMIMGSPAKVKRSLTKEEIEFLHYSAHHYVEVAGNYLR